jgi:hypothetical protein
MANPDPDPHEFLEAFQDQIVAPTSFGRNLQAEHRTTQKPEWPIPTIPSGHAKPFAITKPWAAS